MKQRFKGSKVSTKPISAILRKFNYVVHIYKDLLITQITREEVIVWQINASKNIQYLCRNLLCQIKVLTYMYNDIEIRQAFVNIGSFLVILI